MLIDRLYQDQLEDWLMPGKVLVLYGPRQAGKTTLLNRYLAHTPHRYRLASGDDLLFREEFATESIAQLTQFLDGYDLLAIDEAQRIPNVGANLKLVVDHIKNIRVMVTGSASFDLATKIGEPLTGRKLTRTLYPIAQQELRLGVSEYDLKQNLASHLIFGSYPEVVTTKSNKHKIELLNELVSSYLLKDVLELERVRSPKVLIQLLRLLCYQIGKEVSLAELGSSLKVNVRTVARYLALLEKAFVIKSVQGFSRNLRKEIAKSERYYFLDNGVVNTLISNFSDLDKRDDQSALWKNFVFSERLKANEYSRHHCNQYFWRTYDQQEIDLVEEHSGSLFAYEFKYGEKKPRIPIAFKKAYPDNRFEVINPENYLEFLGWEV